MKNIVCRTKCISGLVFMLAFVVVVCQSIFAMNLWIDDLTDDEVLYLTLQMSFDSYQEDQVKRINGDFSEEEALSLILKKSMTPRGLINASGVNCYMNATLQLLAHSPGFITWLTKTVYDKDAISNQVKTMLLDDLQQSSVGAIDYKNLANNLLKRVFCNNEIIQQEDASEFLIKFLDIMHEEDVNKAMPNFIVEVQKIIWCDTCGAQYTSEVEKNYSMVLPLSLPGNALQSLIDNHVPEKLSDYRCDYCKQMDTCIAVSNCVSASDLLCIQLQRTCYDGMVSHKNMKNVTIPAEFSIVCDNELIWYRTTGVILHRGEMVTSGHYTTLVRKNDNFFLCDDSNVIDGAFVWHELQMVGSSDVYGEPYILFAEKIQ